jgi:hypothetical protein
MEHMMSSTLESVTAALVNSGTVAKAYIAADAAVSTDVNNTPTAVTGATDWYGSAGFRLDKYEVFAANTADPSGLTFDFALVPASGQITYSVGTVIAYDANYVVWTSNGTDYIAADSPTALNPIHASTTYPISDLVTSGGTYTPPPTICFLEGTRIRTERGEIAVENLVEGDIALVLENGAETTRPVVWIGHREINLITHPDPQEAQPIRFRRDAFAKGVPSRDVLVSGDHAIFVRTALVPDGVLIPARLLVNGTSIVRETRLGRIRYFHVELDRHSVVFAENLPSESYLDTGNRSFFQNSGGVVDLHATFGAKEPLISRDTHSCAPFVYAPKSVLPIWTRLAQRGADLGYGVAEMAATHDPEPRLSVNGREYRPVRSSNDVFSFMLPSSPSDVRLLSRAARPCDARPWIEDRRTLGVSVSRIRVRQGQDVVDVPLDGQALGSGWWDVERDGVQMTRWTNGDARMLLPEGEGSSRVVEITMGGGMIYPVDTDGFEANARSA